MQEKKQPLHYNPVPFVEDYYTLPDAIKLIENTFKIQLNNKGKATYSRITKRLRREIESINLDGTEHIKKESARKTKYSRSVLDAVVNKKLYLWFCSIAEEIDRAEFEEWRSRVKKYGEPYGRTMALEELKKRPVDVEGVVEEEFQRRKQAIVMDFFMEHLTNYLMEYILSECIDLDEELLREDIELDQSCDEATISEYDLMVNARLQNDKNYYTVKNEPTLELFK